METIEYILVLWLLATFLVGFNMAVTLMKLKHEELEKKKIIKMYLVDSLILIVYFLMIMYRPPTFLSGGMIF